MTQDRKAKMLEKVRALLAKADSTKFEGEADVFRAKADELMTAYAIEAWQVELAQEGATQRPKPERRDFDFNWWRESSLAEQLWALFHRVSRHCRCVVVTSKLQFDYGAYKMPVVGLPSDLDYFDMMFTHLMLTLIRQIDPQPSKDLGVEENLAMLREAGLPWRPALERMINAGLIEGPYTRDVYEKQIARYRKWCKRTGHPQSYVNQRTYRRNFANGFVWKIGDRLAEMDRTSREAYDRDHAAGGAALAIRDIRQVVQDAVYEMFPELKNRKRSPVKWVKDNRKIDYAAVSAGAEAGRKADLQGHPGRRVGKTPELPS